MDRVTTGWTTLSRSTWWTLAWRPASPICGRRSNGAHHDKGASARRTVGSCRQIGRRVEAAPGRASGGRQGQPGVRAIPGGVGRRAALAGARGQRCGRSHQDRGSGRRGAFSLFRGLGLFLVLVAAVLVRETARLIVAAWMDLRLRAILLLPIGGLYAYANPESQENANQGGGQFAIAFAGPLANGATALALAATFMGTSGDMRLLNQPFVTSAYLLRSMVWMQAGLGLLHLLPAYPLDCGRLLRGSFGRKLGIAHAGRAAAGLGQVLALTAMVAGMLLHSYWLIIAGFFIMVGAQVEDQGVFFQSVVDTVKMREVMLTDFATLSPSDTLADALVRCVHSLQEDFPVVRGPELVGIVSRQRILDALRSDGNGYVQAVMSRAFQVARPEDTLGATIRWEERRV